MELKKRFKLYKSGKMWCCAAVAFGVLAFGTVNGQADTATPVNNQSQVSVATPSQSSTVTSTDNSTNTGSAAAVTSEQSSQTSTSSAQTSQTPVAQPGENTNTQSAHAATNSEIGTVNTLDISAFQPNISEATYQQYHNQGINNMVVKLSEGTDWVNTYAQQQVTRASQAGMNVSAYHFVRFTSASQAQAEAQLFARMARGIGLSSNTLMIADVEQVPQTLYAGIANNLNVFWQTLSSLGFTNHGVYTGLYYDYQYNVSSTVGKARTWVAAYGPYQNAVRSHGYGAWQYTNNWNGTHIDASIDYGMFTNYAAAKTSAANLDGITLNANNNTMTVSGWFADNDSQGKSNRYVILLDANTNAELARQKVNAGSRADVANAYPDIYGASTSGFSANFQLTGKLANAIAAGHSVKVIFRYTSSNDGNSSYTDNTFNAVSFNKNVASLDSMTVTSNGISVSGWHATNQSMNRQDRYLILYDATTKREIERTKISNVSRSDVARAEQDVYGSGTSGFSANFAMNNALRTALQNGDSLQVISRYTNDSAGNGNAVDYWFTPRAYNHNESHIDNFSLTNDGHIQVAGWHTADQSVVEPYQWVILIDSQTGREVARVKAATTSRPDVARQYPGILNAANSGFTASFDIASSSALRNALLQGHALRVVTRYTDNSTDGGGNYTNYWIPTLQNVSQSFNENYGHLDAINRTSDGVHVAGWHISNQAVARPYHYVILYDATARHEVARTQVAPRQRNDVQRVYPNVYHSAQSGFNTVFTTSNNAQLRNALANGHLLQVIDRYSATQGGNSDYVDYWFPAHTL